MRVLYLSQYFPPEIGATQTRAWEMARGLVKAGHEVTMITEVPNHPAGVIQSEYRGKFWDRSLLDGIEVIRVWVLASEVKTFVRRLAFYLTFMGMAVFAGLFLARKKFDLVYATSPPLFVGAAAVAISTVRRMPMVFEVRDLWPEWAVELGQLPSGLGKRVATWLEERCYKHALRIVIVGKEIERRLIARGVSAEKLVHIPNGANTDVYHPMASDPLLRRALGLEEGQFVVMYAGLHGLAQDLETALEAARLLRERPEIVFVFLGDGPRKEALCEQAAEMNLPGVVFHDAVPEIQVPHYLALAHVGLLALRRLDVSRSAMPAKLFSYMACGLPVVLAIEGEAEDLLRRAEAGLIVAPENPQELAKAILKLQSDPDLAARYRRAGVEFVRAHYSRQELAGRLVAELEEVVGGSDR
jgi:glycosyltransferase involved in cell wall biosynthesis